MEEDRLIPVQFSEDEWQYLRRKAEHAGTSVQQEVREAVRAGIIIQQEIIRAARRGVMRKL